MRIAWFRYSRLVPQGGRGIIDTASTGARVEFIGETGGNIVTKREGVVLSAWPRITLVTPSFNQAQYIEATIESVLSQDYPNLEYIVVDGGSTDGSAEIIARYSKHLAWWTSESDQGQTHALEKGFARATGDILNWINSDDLLLPGALAVVADARQANAADLVVGRCRHFSSDVSTPLRVVHPKSYSFPQCIMPWIGEFIHDQPSTFFTRSLYERVSGLDRSLHYVMDFDFYCRSLALQNLRVCYVDRELAAFREHENAKTSLQRDAFTKETRGVVLRMAPPEWGHAEYRGLDRWSAHGAIHNAADAIRRAHFSSAVRSLFAAYKYAPLYATTFVASKCIDKLTRAQVGRKQ